MGHMHRRHLTLTLHLHLFIITSANNRLYIYFNTHSLCDKFPPYDAMITATLVYTCLGAKTNKGSVETFVVKKTEHRPRGKR